MGTELNPLVIAREKAGLSRLQLAQRAGLGYGVVANTELGYSLALSPAMVANLAKAGLDVEGLDDRYRRWRAAQGRKN